MAKQKETPESKGRFQDALDKLDKAYGKGTVITLDSKPYGKYDVFSSGSLGVDWITLGVGGFIYGKVYELMGWEGTGKSTMCGHAAANCQAQGKNVLYIDGEHAVDMEYFKALGVDTSKLLFAQPSSGEEGFNVAFEMMRSGNVSLIIIDSDSSLLPQKAVDGDIGDSMIGKKAMLNNSAYPKLKAAADINHVCLIIISQYREKIGVMFGNPTTTQGGHALKFYTDCRLEISRSLSKDGDVTVGNTTKVKATKNKMSSPYRTAQFDILFGKGIDIYGEVLEYAVEFGIVIKSGSWFSYQETKIGQGKSAVRDLLIDNPELFEEIKGKVIEKIKGADILIEELEKNI